MIILREAATHEKSRYIPLNTFQIRKDSLAFPVPILLKKPELPAEAVAAKPEQRRNGKL